MRSSRLLRRLTIATIVGMAAAVLAIGLASASEAPPKHHPNVERWRPLVERYWAQHGYADEVEFAMMVMYAESTGVPTALNPTSDASGLFQHLPKYWADRSARAGWAGADIFDPEANIAVAAWLRATSHERGWYHWAPVWDRTPIGSWGPDTHFDMGRGWYRNMGGGSLGTRTAPSPPPPTAQISMAKSAGEADARGVPQGATFTWTFTIENTGEIDLEALEIVDDALGVVACPETDLPVGATVQCTASEVAGVGPGGGAATAVAVAANGDEASATAVGTYQGIPDTGLEMRGAELVDETVLRFENTGRVDLWSLGVWIDDVGAFTCPQRSLGPGDIAMCTIPAGSVVGDAWAWTDGGLRVAASHH
ncbi:MAG TPA: transglycosylase SLT domain-containing protein [Acidimicrobiia bacterium]|nr:transglycosylase SLT domain-containing protein [Acidimicrobiia bacterium]